MKRILTLILLSLSFQGILAQDYSDEIYLDSFKELNGTFIVKGKAQSKKSVEENAKMSIIYNLLYRGIDGVNDGKAIIHRNAKEKKAYTASFFNTQKKYNTYIIECKPTSKSQKKNGYYECTYRVDVHLRLLLNDLSKNAVDHNGGYNDDMSGSQSSFSIMVVPMKQKNSDSYIELYNNDRNLRTAAIKVQEAFDRFNIETQNIKAIEKLLGRKSEYAESADVATSNERELLLQSEADVLVEVDVEIINEPKGKKASINLTAYEIATMSNWANATFSSAVVNTNDAAALCSAALQGKALGNFIKEIQDDINRPVSVNLEFTLGYEADFTFFERDSNGKRLADVVGDWVEENSFEGIDDPKGTNDASIYYDNLRIPQNDSKGKRMTIAKYAKKLSDDLYKQGIDNKYTTDGKLITITILSKED